MNFYHRLLSIPLFFGIAIAGLVTGAIDINASVPKIWLELPAAPQPALGRIDIPIRIEDAANLGAWEFDLLYNPTFLSVETMTINPAFGVEFDCNAQSQRCAVSLGPIADGSGTANLGAVSYGKTGGMSGDGLLAVLHLIPTGKIGVTSLTLTNALVTDSNAQATTPTVEGGNLTLVGSENQLFLPSVTR